MVNKSHGEALARDGFVLKNKVESPMSRRR
ncbi:MAG: hypothetical protein IPO07_21770, partial [Haliscomenobacter sp.]|nr:hypothetical protein [Haliscomenobacter sp.]